jgi:hypothetical protein
MDTVCLLDDNSMKVDYLNLSNSSNSIIPRFPSIQPQVKSGRTIASSTAFLNATNTGYFIAIEPFTTVANRLTISNNTNIQDAFDIFPFEVSRDDSMVKCIDIDHINAFACISDGGLNVVLTKLDERKQQTSSRTIIKNKRK